MALNICSFVIIPRWIVYYKWKYPVLELFLCGSGENLVTTVRGRQGTLEESTSKLSIRKRPVQGEEYSYGLVEVLL